MPREDRSGGTDRLAAFYDAHPDRAIDPGAHPGYVWGTLDPHDNSGLNNAWVLGTDWARTHPTGWTNAQLLVAALPFALGGAGALGAFGGGAASGSGLATMPGTALGMEAAPAGIGAGAGAAAAAHAGGAMAGFGIGDALQYGPLIASLFMGHGSSNAVPYGDQLNALLGEQRQRMQASDPLYQAILRMAMGLVPPMYRGPMGGAPAGGSLAVPRDRAMTRTPPRAGY
jgi:hypothetical protein